MIAKCEHCGEQVFTATDQHTGAPLKLDAAEILGGKYELVGSEARLRLTPGGRVKTAGKGMRLHAGRCTANKLPTNEDKREPTTDPLLAKLQAEPKFSQATNGLSVPSVVRDAVELIGPEGNVTDYHDWTGHATGRVPCGVCKRLVIVAHLRPSGEGGIARVIRPVILDAAKVPKLGAWRAYKPAGQSDIVATFLGKRDDLARYVNHRHICPTTRPA